MIGHEKRNDKSPDAESNNDEINDDLNVKTEMNNTEDFENEVFLGKGGSEKNSELPNNIAICRSMFA